ncbi:MAG: carbon monoxide dehydrogenase subunit G [Paracoccaceae bacterium]|nr:carbon monoxide dehydrogenase subunit G [Paracoccaceae bacterium]
MKMTGSKQITASNEKVWQAILSAEVLQRCVPGCQEMSGSASEGFEATVVQKAGPVKATFKGQVTLSEMVQGQGLKLSGQGKGGAAGFAKGSATVTLTSTDGITILSYDVEAKVGGKLAQLGSRIIDGFAKKMADQFFERFRDAVENPEDQFTNETTEDDKKGWLTKLTG